MNFKPFRHPGIWIGILASLAFGALAGSSIWHSGIGLIFLAALAGGAALLSLGLGRSRLLVGIAMWLGQYCVFYWRFVEPVETAAPLFMVRNFFVFMPAMAIVVGGYAGLVSERIYRAPERRSQLPE